MQETTTQKTEILIIGGGLSGLTTALELLDQGKKIIIAERGIQEKLGGLAKESFGGMFLINSKNQKRMGIKDSEELAFADWKSFAEFGKDDQLPIEWAKKYIHYSANQIPHWLKNKGVGFFPVVHWVERGLYTPGNTVPRFHMVWGTGKGLVDAVVGKIESHPNRKNLTIYYQRKIEDLLTKDGQVLGALGVDELNKTPFEIQAEITIVATGGINGSIEKVKQHWPKSLGEAPEKILNGSHEYADGLMHDQIQKIGGNITHLDKMWNYAAGVHHPNPIRPNHGLSLVPPKSALWMNYKGKRIGPTPLITAYDTSFLVKSICSEERKYSWQILNWKIALKEMAVSGSEHNQAIRDKKLFSFLKNILFGNKKLVTHLTNDCEDFVVAHSVSEMVDKMNDLNFGEKIDANFLENEIKKYDDQIDRGPKFFNDDQLRRLSHVRQYRGDKVRTCKFQKILDKKAMPLIAIREFILSRKSLGGIQTDLDCKVLNNMNQPIKGLYAIGEAAGFGGGGVHGKRALEGTFLGSCIGTGIIAAESIKKEI